MNNQSFLKKTVLAFAVGAALSSSFAQAKNLSQQAYETDKAVVYPQEKKYMAGGAVIGAIVGGPAGFVVGLFSGGVIGHTDGMKEELKTGKQALAKQQQEIVALRKQVANQNERLASMSKKHQQEKKVMLASLGNVPLGSSDDFEKLLQESIQLSVHFRTNSPRVENHFQYQLKKLAIMLKKKSRLKIHLQGFADVRGSEKKNQALSIKRVEAIRTILIQAGIPAERIEVTAWGEKSSLKLGKDLESLSFDRRVLISFSRLGGAS